ncbi:hypothetical protein [Streptomyces sp. NPDC023838]|uniref:hypothetical protein n=1 Tax=Streptomyces sp. NPDC023838 TaxID=3154325 RepID=UPI0033C3DD57
MPVSPTLPAELHQPRGFGGRLGSHLLSEPPEVTSVFDIDDLAEDGPSLITATSTLATGLIQHFGYPEALQMTAEGSIRKQYWSTERYGPRVWQWAEEAGVLVVEDTVG